MEKIDKPLTREALISMQVIDANGRLLGKVKDIAFSVGKSGISLTVENKNGEVQSISWDQVQAASDFILIKPSPQTSNQTQTQQQTAQNEVQEKSNQPLCPTCSQPLTWIPQYKRWYCYNDKKYVSVDKKGFFGFLGSGSNGNAKPSTDKPAAQQTSNHPLCPTCNQPLTWIPQYKRWYCYNDKKYV